MQDEDGDGASPMQVDPELLRTLAELLKEKDLSEIEIGDGGRRIRLRRRLEGTSVTAAPPPPQAAVAPAQAAGPAASGGDAANIADHPGAVKSPMVGTAYLASSPADAPFVAVGDAVSEGDTLLIVEAMKVMNPIAATKTGTVRRILVQDAQPVEYDQPLVIVE